MENRNQYAIYKVYLSESQEKTLFLSETDGTSILSHAQEHFGSYFGDSMLNIYRTKEDGENIIYPNDILRNEDNVIVLRLNNVQYKKLVKRKESPGGGAPEYQEVREESNPYSYIIIDNRPGVCLMAIQVNGAWGSRSDTVRDLLQECFHHRLVNDYGLDIMINAKIHPTKFWEFVKHQTSDNGDRIKRFQIDVLNSKKTAPVVNESQVPVGGWLKSVSDFVERGNMLKACIAMDTDANAPIPIEQQAEDWNNIIEACSTRYYNLSVHFEKMGVYRCDQEVMALYPLDNGTLNNFINGSKNLSVSHPDGEYALVQWLDFIHQEIKDYKDAQQTPKKPKRNRKK